MLQNYIYIKYFAFMNLLFSNAVLPLNLHLLFCLFWCFKFFVLTVFFVLSLFFFFSSYCVAGFCLKCIK